MSTPFGVPSGAGATGPKRGTAGRGHATRGGLNPFARPGGSTRGGRGGATGTRGGRGRGDSTLPAARGSIGARRGGAIDATRGSRLERPASAAGPLRGIRGHLTKALQGDRNSKSAAPLQNNIDRTRDPRRQTRGGSPKANGPQDYVGRYEQLKKSRAKERAQAISTGQMADPNQPTSLNRAITPTGTCTDMCPEFERVERIVQKMVDKNEKDLDADTDSYQIVEAKMIKRFRRSAAGYDEQLPSDIRTPATLLQTLNYMLRHVIADDETLGLIHKFVWDRTRSIRNDLSIQQLTQIADVQVAVKCLERIARFHILSLHILSSPDNTEQFDHHQEREQLNNTFLSLLYYYDDNRDRVKFVHEDEFRAYYILFAIHDQRPDLEARVQKWPHEIRQSPRIKVALELFAAASNTWEYQGTLDSKRPNAIAQGFYSRFFSILRSNRVSYLMACIAEIYFNQVRQTAIRSIWKAYCRQPLSQQHKNHEWTIEELTKTLCFDDNDQTIAFCEAQGLQLTANPEGNIYLDWADRSVDSVDFQPSSEQVFSDNLVESKRRGRSLAAVILGMNVAQSIKNGMIDQSRPVSISPEKDDSLFVSDDEEDKVVAPTESIIPFGSQATNTPINPFGVIKQQNTAPQVNNVFGSQSGPRLSAAASTFTPQSSFGSTTAQPTNPTPFSSPFQAGPSGGFSAGTNIFGTSQAKAPLTPSSTTFPSPSITSNNRPSFGSLETPFGAPAAPIGGQLTPATQAQPTANPFFSSTAATGFGKPDSSTQLEKTQSPSPFGAPVNSNPFGKVEGVESDKSKTVENVKPLADIKAVEVPKPSNPLFQPFPSTFSSQPSVIGQGQVGATGPFGQIAALGSNDASRSTTPPGVPSFLPAEQSKSPSSQIPQAPAQNNATFNWFNKPAEEPKQPGFEPPNEANDETKKAELEAKERVMKEIQKKREEKIEADKREVERKETERREAAVKEAERIEIERKEREKAEAARREAERMETERKEAERRAAEEREAAKKAKEKRDREMAKKIAAEIKAGQRDIAKLKESERQTQERDAALKQAIEQEILAKRKTLHGEEEFPTSSKGKSKARRLSSSNEGLLTVEDLLGDFEQPASQKEPPKPEGPQKSTIDEDELLLNAARMVAHQLSQGRLFDWAPSTLEFGASVSLAKSYSPVSGPSRTRSFSSTLEGDRAIVNGYEVALAPSTPGLGRSLSRTEQRIRLTGANGLAYKPLTPLRRSATTKEESKPKTKRLKKEIKTPSKPSEGKRRRSGV